MIQGMFDVAMNDAEHKALALWLDGERRTPPLAQALGLGPVAQVDQRREVKRFKDRILKRMARLTAVRGR